MQCSKYALIGRCLVCALVTLASTACRVDTDGVEDDDQADTPRAGHGSGGAGSGGNTHGGAGGKKSGAGGTSGSGGARSHDPSVLPSFAGQDASGITRLAKCALAADGACVREADRDQQSVCDRWRTDYPQRSSKVFLGASGECDPGETDPQAIEDSLRRLNLYRWLVGLDPVPEDAAWTEDARACAIIQAHLGKDRTHFPEPSAECYSEQGGKASGQSNLAVGYRDPASAIDGLLFDAGANNAHALGHRQLLLHPGLHAVGIGYTQAERTDPVLGADYGSTCVEVFTESMGLGPRTSGLDGMIAYPAPGAFPYEPISWALLGTARGNDAFDRRLQWSLSFADDTDVDGASVRVFRQTDDAFDEIAIEFGALTDTMRGLWISPKADVGPGTYVVIVDGTSLGAFGYRSALEPCGPRLNTTCDVADQDCGDESAGCYDLDAPYCAIGAGIALGEVCDDRKLTDCEHGGICSHLQNNGADADEQRCTSYCDANDASSPVACDALCPGQVVILTGADGAPQPLAICNPGSGGTCDPLAQDCDKGRGCYGREAVTCALPGITPRGEPCTGAGTECEPGTDCIGAAGGTPVCSPYCDPANSADGALACSALCPGGNWPFDGYAICIPM